MFIHRLFLRRNWRISIAYHRDHVDKISDVPLAIRVCMSDAGLEYASQADAFQAIFKHEKDNVGPLLTTLCALMWLMTGMPYA